MGPYGRSTWGAPRRSVVGAVREMVGSLEPFDDVEAAHLRDALGWLGSTGDVFRRSTAPTRPLKHVRSRRGN